VFLILGDGAGGWSAGVEVGKVRKMKFRVDANEANKHMVVMSLAGMKADDYSPKQKDGKNVLSEDGKQLYSVRNVHAYDTDRQREMQNTFIAVMEPAEIHPMARYVFDGDVWIKPYAMNGRLGMTIEATRLVSVK